MQNCEWITWKTETNDIINPDIILEKMDSFFDEYYKKMEPIIYDSMKNEVLNGGLSNKSFNISGSSPSNEMAIEIIKKIEEVNEVYQNLKNSVSRLANEQKAIEKTQYVHAIENAIREEEEYNSKIEVPKEQKSQVDSISSDILYISSDRIQKLKEKLAIAEAL